MVNSGRINTEIQKRREDIYFAYYVEGISIGLLMEYSGYSRDTIKRDLAYIQENMSEFDGTAEELELLESDEDVF